MRNADFARALTSLATYRRVVRLYWPRRGSERVRPFLRVWVRQAARKRREG